MLINYAGLAAGAWFLGFFPLAEIYVAVPLAMASGLDAVSAFFWSVLGNATPILLVHFAYDRAMRSDRLKSWMHRLVSDRATARFNRWGLWFVLIATPWTGVWVMAATSKVLRLEPRRFIPAALVSITVYAAIIAFALHSGAALAAG
ncbi:MAG: small multi-drug export protein [Chloroflexi bacterium]|jgi:uncharacterized membrane protein|nr:hypothetical protein [Chloroflexota bacterium]MCO6443929.1 small multi-drug export protein [Anaerolineae bacterium]MDL1915076.1 hypothetical protein [Anaerolineae bacterium CFX4]OQY86881.1 MAG: hypothetical protein B6D42_00315 [Anaerolineae bacterium UTCFX5]MCC6564271.1 small multi-drug export protein [Chloroflexota bacterium]